MNSAGVPQTRRPGHPMSFHSVSWFRVGGGIPHGHVQFGNPLSGSSWEDVKLLRGTSWVIAGRLPRLRQPTFGGCLLHELQDRAGCCGHRVCRGPAEPGWVLMVPRARVWEPTVPSGGRGTQQPRGRESPEDPNVPWGGGENGPASIFRAWTVGSSLGSSLAC